MKIRRWSEDPRASLSRRKGEGRGDGWGERGLKRSTPNLLGKGNKSRVRWKNVSGRFFIHVGEWSWLAWNNGGEIWESGNTPDRVVVRNYQIGRPFFSFLFLSEPVYRYKSISASRIWKISIDFERRRNVDEYSMKILITIIDNNSFISPYKRRRKKEELIYTLQVDTIKFVSLRCINIVTANVSRSTLILRFNFTVLISLPVFCGFFEWDWIIKYCGRGREGDTGLCGLLFLIFVNWTIPSVRLTVHMHICGIYIYIYINMRERERERYGETAHRYHSQSLYFVQQRGGG